MAALKIKPADLARLREAITPLDTPGTRQRYIRGDFPRADRCKDKDTRYRWDLLHACGRHGAGLIRDLDLYAYLDDSHIDSALRSIVPPLEDA